MKEIEVLRNLPLMPYQGVWEVLQRQAEEEEKKKKKQEEKKDKEKQTLKPEPLPPAIQINESVARELAPKPIAPRIGPLTPEEFAEERQRKSAPTIAQMERKTLTGSQKSAKSKPGVLKAGVDFFDFNLVSPERGETLKSMEPKQDFPKESRVLAVLRGEPDPIWSHEEYQKNLDLINTFNILREKQNRQQYDPPTGLNWIDEQPDADLEKIKRGIAAGELLVKTGEIGNVEYYKRDPETGAVSKDRIQMPLSYYIYGLVPRKIGDVEYRVPTLKPLYFVDRNGNVYKVSEGLLKETVKTMGTKLFGIETWDKMLSSFANLRPQVQEDFRKVPYMPKSFWDAILGASTNLPFSNRTLMEPGGEPVEYKPNQPLYLQTQPYQEIINKNPYTWAEYGLGNILAPLMDLPKLGLKHVPQLPVTTPQIGEEFSKEELEKFKSKLEKDELLATVYNTVAMLPAGVSRVLTGVLALSYMAAPLTSSVSRPIESRLAESLLNGALFFGLGKIGKAGKYIREGKPIPVKVVLQDASKRLGLAVGGETFRHSFFVPYQSEEDAWQVLKPYVYTLGVGLMFEVFGLGHVVKHNKQIRQNLPPEIYRTLTEFVKKHPKATREDIQRFIEETKKEVDSPQELKAVNIVEEALDNAYTVAEDVYQKLQNKLISVEEARKIAEEKIKQGLQETIEPSTIRKAPAPEESVKQEGAVAGEPQPSPPTELPVQKVTPVEQLPLISEGEISTPQKVIAKPLLQPFTLQKPIPQTPPPPLPTETQTTRPKRKAKEPAKMSDLALKKPQQAKSKEEPAPEEQQPLQSTAKPTQKEKEISQKPTEEPKAPEVELPPLEEEHVIGQKVGGLNIDKVEKRGGVFYAITAKGERKPFDQLSVPVVNKLTDILITKKLEKGEIEFKPVETPQPPEEVAQKGITEERPVETLEVPPKLETPAPPPPPEPPQAEPQSAKTKKAQKAAAQKAVKKVEKVTETKEATKGKKKTTKTKPVESEEEVVATKKGSKKVPKVAVKEPEPTTTKTKKTQKAAAPKAVEKVSETKEATKGKKKTTQTKPVASEEEVVATKKGGKKAAKVVVKEPEPTTTKAKKTKGTTQQKGKAKAVPEEQLPTETQKTTKGKKVVVKKETVKEPESVPSEETVTVAPSASETTTDIKQSTAKELASTIKLGWDPDRREVVASLPDGTQKPYWELPKSLRESLSKEFKQIYIAHGGEDALYMTILPGMGELIKFVTKLARQKEAERKLKQAASKPGFEITPDIYLNLLIEKIKQNKIAAKEFQNPDQEKTFSAEAKKIKQQVLKQFAKGDFEGARKTLEEKFGSDYKEFYDELIQNAKERAPQKTTTKEEVLKEEEEELIVPGKPQIEETDTAKREFKKLVKETTKDITEALAPIIEQNIPEAKRDLHKAALEVVVSGGLRSGLYDKLYAALNSELKQNVEHIVKPHIDKFVEKLEILKEKGTLSTRRPKREFVPLTEEQKELEVLKKYPEESVTQKEIVRHREPLYAETTIQKAKDLSNISSEVLQAYYSARPRRYRSYRERYNNLYPDEVLTAMDKHIEKTLSSPNAPQVKGGERLFRKLEYIVAALTPSKRNEALDELVKAVQQESIKRFQQELARKLPVEHPERKEKFLNAVTQGLQRVSLELGKLTEENIQDDGIKYIHKLLNQNKIKQLTVAEQNVLDNLWNYVNTNKPMFGPVKNYRSDPRLWERLQELHRLYKETIEDYNTRGPINIPDEIFVRAQELMHAGYKNPHYILEKLNEEFPQYPGHLKPSVNWLERQIKLRHSHRPYRPIPFDDFASFSSKLDALSQFYVNEWRPSEVLVNLFKQDLSPRDKARYMPFLDTEIPDILRTDKPLIFDYLRGTLKDKNVKYFFEFVEKDVHLTKELFYNALMDYDLEHGPNFVRNDIKNIIGGEPEQLYEILADRFAERYLNAWYKPVTIFGEKLARQYKQFDEILNDLNKHFPLLVDMFKQIDKIIAQHEYKYRKLSQTTQASADAKQLKEDFINTILRLDAVRLGLLKNYYETDARLSFHLEKKNPDRNKINRLQQQVRHIEEQLRSAENKLVDAIEALRDYQETIIKELNPNNLPLEDLPIGIKTLLPSTKMQQIYKMLPEIKKGSVEDYIPQIKEALDAELSTLKLFDQLTESKSDVVRHRDMVKYYQTIQNKLVDFMKVLAKEFQKDPTGMFLKDEKVVETLKQKYNESIPKEIREVLMHKFIKADLEGKELYSKLEGLEELKKFLEKYNVVWENIIKSPEINEWLDKEFAENPQLRRMLLEKMVEAGYDADKIYLRLRTMFPHVDKRTYWEDFAEVSKQLDNKVKILQALEQQEKSPWDVVASSENFPKEIASEKDIKKIFEVLEDLSMQDVELGISSLEESFLTQVKLFGDNMVQHIISRGGYLKKGFEQFQKDFQKVVEQDEIWKKSFEAAGYNEQKLKQLFDDIKAVKEELIDKQEQLNVDESKLQIHPISIIWTSAIIANYVLPEDQEELKKAILYGAVAATGGYLGHRIYRNYKNFGRLTQPLLTEGELNHRIASSLPYIEAVRRFGKDSPEVKKVVEHLKEIHRNANRFTGAPLSIQSKNNPLAKEIAINIKRLETIVNTKHKSLNDKAQKFLKETPDDILGVISAASIKTQRDLYELRKKIKQGKVQKISAEKYAQIKDELLLKNIREHILLMKIKKAPGKDLDTFAREVFQKAKEYRDIIREATEINYRNMAAKLLKIPINRQQKEYERALTIYNELKAKLKDMVDQVRAQRKSYRELNRALLKSISNISPETYVKITKALLSNPRIKKIIKENPDMLPEDLLTYPQFFKSFKYITKRLEETKELRKEVALKIKAIEDLMKENFRLTMKLNDYKQAFKEETKYLKQIIKILKPETIEKYLDKSENLIFWNPLWNRTFGDHGVKIESYEFKDGEPIAPKSEWEAETKVVVYGLKPEDAKQKALHYLQINGFIKSPKYSDIWYKLDQNKNIKDMVRVVEFNKKELDVTKRHIPKFVEDLRTFYGAIGKAYQKVVKDQALAKEDIEIINSLREKVRQFLKDHNIDPAELEDGELANNFQDLYKIANDKSYTKTTLGTILRVLQTTQQTVPMQRYRDFIGYETSLDPLKEASLFKYALLNHIDKLREQGLQFNIYSYVSNDVANYILRNNLVTTRFASYMQNLQNDLLYTPTNMYESGLIKVGAKVFDTRRLIDNVSSLAFFNVFFGNISSAYKNLKYNLIASTINQISEGKSIGETVKDFILKSPNTFMDFVKYVKAKQKQTGEIPQISTDPIKQKTFQILYEGGVFTQSVLDALSTSAAGIGLRDWFNLPTRKTDWLKLLAFKVGFLLQRNSEVLNKLIDFETRYEHLRRRGISNPQQLASEIAVGLGRDVGFYQLHDLGEATRHLSKTPGLNIFLHMMKPAIIQNYNYLETLRVPFVYFKEKLKNKKPLTYTQEQAMNHLKALGAASVLTTLISGWRGAPLLGDIFNFLDKSAEEIDKSNPKFDPRGIQKVKLELLALCKKHLGMSDETFEKYWLQLMYGVDSYLTGRNVSINNLLGPYIQPFLLDFYNRQIKEAAQELGKGNVPVDLLLPAGLEKIKNYLKTVAAGNILIKSKFYDYESGRPLTLKDYLFGYLGNTLEDTEIKYLEGKGYYNFLTKGGRKDFYKKTIAKIFAGSYKTQITQRVLNYLSLKDPEFKKATDVYLLALEIYKNKYLDHVVDSKEKIVNLFKQKSEQATQLMKKLKEVDEEYGRAEAVEDYINLIHSDIANYYQILALNEAYRITFGFKGNFTIHTDRLFNLANVPIEKKGYMYAIRKRLMSKKALKYLEDLQEFFLYPIDPQTSDEDYEFQTK